MGSRRVDRWCSAVGFLIEGFKNWGFGLESEVSGSPVLDSGSEVSGSPVLDGVESYGFRISGFVLRVRCLGCRVGFGVQGPGLEVWGLGFKVWG